MDNFDLKKYISEGKINEEEMDLSYTELSDDEKDEVSDMMDVIYSKINPKGDMKKNTGLFRYIDAWFESKGDSLSRLNEQEEEGNRIDKAELILPRGKKVYLQAEEQDYQRGLIVELTEEGGYKINYWYGADAKIYPAEVEVDGESIKDDAREVYIKFHPELDK